MTKESKYDHHPVRVVKGISLGEEYDPGQIIKLDFTAAAIKTDSLSDLPWTTWDIDDLLPTAITRPRNAVAVILDVDVGDAGSSGEETYIAFATPGIIVAGKTVYCRPDGVNDQSSSRLVIVEMSGDGKIAVSVAASGGTTFDVVAKLVGWVIAGTLTDVVELPSASLKAVFQVSH